MVAILYLAHDLDDSAIWRRVSMLQAGGATVTLAGFRRGTSPLPGAALVLGMTGNGRMVQRIGAVARAIAGASRRFGEMPRPEVILARNLEMLALARRVRQLWPKQPTPGLAYEVLDIHRMMLGDALRGRVMRRAERWLARDIGLLMTSSPAFVSEYFQPHRQVASATPVQLLENKVNGFDLASEMVERAGSVRQVLTIGWFGILRCATSLAALDAVTRAAPGKTQVVLAGRPALDVVPDFHAVVDANPDLAYLGPYRSPEDLPQLYGHVDLAWLVDRYEAGQNSDWLLPNRLYEGCLHGAVPLALAGTEVARHMAKLGIGVVLPRLSIDELSGVLRGLDQPKRAMLAAAVAAVPRSTWVTTRRDAVELVRRLENTAGTNNSKNVAATAALNGATP